MVVPVFLAVVIGLWVRLCTRTTQDLVLPRGTLLGVFAIALTLLQWLPLPDFVRSVLAPGIEEMVAGALVATDVEAWPGLSPSSADTALEIARLAGLLALFVAAAQLTWRVTAALVAATGGIIAMIGFAHGLAGAEAIYGLYDPQYADLSQRPTLVGTFVNANHQGGMFLLGIFSAGALAIDQRRSSEMSRSLEKMRRYTDRAIVALGLLLVQVPALVLTLSRGALASLVVVGTIGLLVWVRPTKRTGRHQRRPRRHGRMRIRIAIALLLGVVVAAFIRHSASRELASLLSLGDRGLETEAKFTTTIDALALIDLSPVVGIGRGAYIDLFPAVIAEPSHVLFTHLESAPVAMLVEWGPVGGAIMVLGLAWWWLAAVRGRGAKADARARGIALLGPLALALQSTGDFSLEFLGVAAPACALAGALSPRTARTWSPRRAWRLGATALVAALVLATLSFPHTWSRRYEQDEAIRRGDLSEDEALRKRPLDGRLHGMLARRAAEKGAWEQARHRAEAATRLSPGSVDGWLIRSAAESISGDAEAADRFLRQGLGLLHEPASEELVSYLLAHWPQARDFARVAPTSAPAWRHLADTLRRIAPAHADAVAAARAEAAPSDPEPRRLRVMLALETQTPGLALHHARLLRQLAPDDAHSHLLVARSLMAFRPRREREAMQALEQALARPSLRDATGLGLIEERLVAALIRAGTAEDLARARELLPRLLARPADRRARKRRQELARRLDRRPGR
jgi:hypothetical protein